jgi:outer membrane protein TolC
VNRAVIGSLCGALFVLGAAAAASGADGAATTPLPRAGGVAATPATPAPAAATRRLTLAEAVALASGQSPAVDLATQRAKEAESRVGQARAALLPGLGGAASASNRTFNLEAQGITIPALPGQPALREPIGPVDNVDARLRVTQALFDVSAWAKTGAAAHGARQARAERDLAGEASAQAAALAYLRAARARAVATARQSDASLANELFALAEAQVAAGVAPGIDATRAHAQATSARGLLIVARNQLARAQIDLARALGLDPGTAFDLADTLSSDLGGSGAPGDPATALALARERRPDLAAELARQAKAGADRFAIAAERLPRIDAAADYGLSGQHGPDAVATRQVGVAVSVPFLDGLRREARLAEQRAVMRESEIRVRDLGQQIAAEVEDAELDLGSGLEQLDVARERLALAEEELGQARERFASGVAGNIELIDAQVGLSRARDADIDARFTVAAARVALARASGVARTIR